MNRRLNPIDELLLALVLQAQPTLPGRHKHQCDDCGTIWEHDNSCGETSTLEEFEQAHSCPRCGQQQTWKYKGDSDAEYVSQLCESPKLVEINA